MNLFDELKDWFEGMPKEYLFMTESYVKAIDQKEKADEALGKLVADGILHVSQLPSSQEATVALHGDRRGEKLGVIVFREKGERVTFSPIKWLKGDELKGRFVNLRERGSK